MLPQYFKKAKLSGNYTDEAMSAQERHRLKKETVMNRIQLIGQVVGHLSPAAALLHTVEYYRFMALKAEYDKDDVPSTLAPSALIDDLWHAHLLDTRSYMMLESLLLPEGGRLHHNPLKDEQADYEGRLTHTKNLYYDLYHSVPPHDIWGNEARVENAAAQEVDHEGVVSDTEEIEHGRIITVEIRHPEGMSLSIRIDKKSLGSVLFDAVVKKWQVDPNAIQLSCFQDFPGVIALIRRTDQWALYAEDGVIVYLRIRSGSETRLENAAAQKVEHDRVASEAEEIKDGRIVTIRHPNGMSLSIRIGKKSLGCVLFDAIVKIWQVHPNAIHLLYSMDIDDVISRTDNLFLSANNVDIFYLRIRLVGC